MSRFISFDDLRAMLASILERAGASPEVAALIGTNCAMCERDGSKSHGIFRMAGYISTINSGWVDPRAVPQIEDAAPAFLRADARNGFAQVALQAARATLLDKVHQNGAAVLAIRGSHHFSALWPDVEPFADEGLIALSVVNSMAVTVPAGARRPLFGTNPIAFAAPADGRAPIVFDMATSAWAHGDIQIAAREGRDLPPGVGVDAEGQPTTDPARVLDGGAMLPFGGHKGSALSMMIELLGAALTGGQFSSEVDWSAHPGAVTPRTGQFLLLIDPAHAGGAAFGARAAELADAMHAAGLSQLPGQRRHKARAESLTRGIPLTGAEWSDLVALAGRPATGPDAALPPE